MSPIPEKAKEIIRRMRSIIGSQQDPREFIDGVLGLFQELQHAVVISAAEGFVEDTDKFVDLFDCWMDVLLHTDRIRRCLKAIQGEVDEDELDKSSELAQEGARLADYMKQHILPFEDQLQDVADSLEALRRWKPKAASSYLRARWAATLKTWGERIMLIFLQVVVASAITFGLENLAQAVLSTFFPQIYLLVTFALVFAVEQIILEPLLKLEERHDARLWAFAVEMVEDLEDQLDDQSNRIVGSLGRLPASKLAPPPQKFRTDLCPEIS